MGSLRLLASRASIVLFLGAAAATLADAGSAAAQSPATTPAPVFRRVNRMGSLERTVILRGATQVYDDVVTAVIRSRQEGEKGRSPGVTKPVFEAEVRETLKGILAPRQRVRFITTESREFPAPDTGRTCLLFLFHCRPTGLPSDMPVLRAVLNGDSALIAGPSMTVSWPALRDTIRGYVGQGSPEALRAGSDIVAHGKIGEVLLSAAASPDQSYGSVELQVQDAAGRDAPAAGSTIRVSLPQPVKYRFANYPLPSFRAGEEVYLFLTREGDAWRLHGGAESKWIVRGGRAVAQHFGLPCPEDTVTVASVPLATFQAALR